MTHKSGFVNIIGKPNVGKSTLMNALVGEKLSIITPKAQTTRHRIMGIVSDKDSQIIFSDTPVVIEPQYKLQESMMKFVDSAFTDADVLLMLTEPGIDPEKDQIAEKLKELQIPVIVVLNKIDLTDQNKVYDSLKEWNKRLPEAEVIPVSALLKFNIEKLLQSIKDKLPDHPPYYDKDTLTDKSERFFVSEIIREKILKFYHKEVHYSIEISVEHFKEEKDLIRIKAYIFVARESQKIIIIGRQGKAIKKLGTEARKDIEDFVGSKVFLELSVKVRKDWRNDPNQLKRFGYEE